MNSIDKHTIERQVQKILSSDQFRNLEICSLFLRFVVEETLAGHMPRLDEYTIATKVLGRSADFNSRLDAAVRIRAARVRRLLSDYYQSEGRSDNVLITMPEKSYIALFRLRS